MRPEFIILKSASGAHFVNPNQILHMYTAEARDGKTVIVFEKETAIVVEETPIEIVKMIYSAGKES